MILSDNTHYHSNVFNQVIIFIIRSILDVHRVLGYRHVHLYTIGGELIANAYLFVHIVISSKSLAVVSARFNSIDYSLFALCRNLDEQYRDIVVR